MKDETKHKQKRQRRNTTGEKKRIQDAHGTDREVEQKLQMDCGRSLRGFALLALQTFNAKRPPNLDSIDSLCQTPLQDGETYCIAMRPDGEANLPCGAKRIPAPPGDMSNGEARPCFPGAFRGTMQSSGE